MTQEHVVWDVKPAARWNEAYPIGNGRLGAMLFGGFHTERIQLNEDSVWYGGPRDRVNPEARRHVDRVRALLMEGRVEEAEILALQTLRGTPRHQNPYQPLGDLTLEFPRSRQRVEAYQRSLDLHDGIARVSYQRGERRYTREVFSSALDQVLVVHLSVEGEVGDEPVTVMVNRRPFEMRSGTLSASQIYIDGQAGPDGVHYACVLEAVAPRGEVQALGDTMVVRGAPKVTLLLAANTTFRHDDPRGESVAQIEAARAKGYRAMREAHVEEHRSLFERVSISLGGSETGGDDGSAAEEPVESLSTPARIERVRKGALDPGLDSLLFQFGRYLLMASSRPGSLPANLQGIWNESMTPPWESKYTININIQMNYWPAEVGSLPECHLPLFDHLERMRASGAATAEKMYGCRGWVAHHNTNLWGDTAPTDATHRATQWPFGAAWFALHLWEHYRYSGERTFLERRAYPLMRDASVFLLDLMRPDEEGRLLTGPSVSPENGYIMADGTVGSLCMAPAMDRQIIRELFRATIEAGRTLDLETDVSNELQSALERVPPDQVGKHGQLMEWLEDYNEVDPGHRHISHLFALFPGSQIDAEATPELFAAAKESLQRREAHEGGKGWGWSFAWMACCWARLGEGAKAMEHIARYRNECLLPNLLNEGGGHVQVDGTFGVTAAIAEMLLQSHTDEIVLLPALPPDWPDGEVRGLRARGGVEVGLVWRNGTLIEATLRADRDGAIKVRFPSGARVTQVAPVRGEQPALHSLGDTIVALHVSQGERYTLRFE